MSLVHSFLFANITLNNIRLRVDLAGVVTGSLQALLSHDTDISADLDQITMSSQTASSEVRRQHIPPTFRDRSASLLVYADSAHVPPPVLACRPQAFKN